MDLCYILAFAAFLYEIDNLRKRIDRLENKVLRLKIKLKEHHIDIDDE